MTVKAEITTSRRRKDGAGPKMKGAASQQVSRFTGKEPKNKKIIKPVYDPGDWSDLLGYSTRYRKCVDLMAHNTVGLGQDVVIDEEILETLTPEEQGTAEAAQKELQALINAPNPGYDFSVLVADLLKKDEESTGSCYVEVQRLDEEDDDGKHPIVGFSHLPSKSMRVLENGNFLSRKYRTDRYFKPFGSERDIDYLTGDPIGERPDTGKKGKSEARQAANEVIMLRLFSPMDETYGVPRAATALASIIGQYKVDLRNVTFFDYDALARLIITMTGGTIDDGKLMKEQVEQFVDQNRGNNETSRVMRIHATAPRNGKGDAPEIKIQEIGKYTQDATFLEYRKECQEDVREAFGIAKILLGTATDVNRASALTSLKSTIDNVFRPETRRWSYVWTNSVARDFHPALKIQFHESTVSDLEAQIEERKSYGEVGDLSINEIRERDGREPDEDDRANIPLALLRLTIQDEELRTAAGKMLASLEAKAKAIREAKEQ